MRLFEVNGDLIDLNEVYRVGRVGGNKPWHAYTVYFKDGSSIEIHQNNVQAYFMMKREDFVDAWINKEEA